MLLNGFYLSSTENLEITLMLEIKLLNNFESQNKIGYCYKNNLWQSPSSLSFLGRLLKPLIKDDEVLRIFKEEITPIPRASGHCEEISSYLAQELEKCGFKVDRQQSGSGKGNIYATRNVLPGNKNAIVLQAHMDMVYVSKAKRGQKVPVVPVVNGDYLMAKNTSLGADNGIGLALALAIARIDDPTIKRIPLQIVFTVDEEEGLIGAQDIPPETIKGKYLINFDNGNPDKLIAGCAGLVDFNIREKYPEVKLQQISNHEHVKMIVEIIGAQGGHSALTINKGRMNPIVSLLKLLEKHSDEIKICQFNGGDEINSIPQSAAIEILVPHHKFSGFSKQLKEDFEELKGAYKKADSGVKLKLASSQQVESGEVRVLAPEFQKSLFENITKEFRQGVIYQEEGSKKPVISQNIGVLSLVDGKIFLKSRIRSNNKQKQQEESEHTQKIFSNLLSKKIEPTNETPVWEQKEDAFSRLAAKAYEEIFDKSPIICNTHGSVEGAVLNKYVDGMVGVGPAIKLMHTPAERLFIPSLGPVCDFVETLIRNIYNKLLNKSAVQTH